MSKTAIAMPPRPPGFTWRMNFSGNIPYEAVDGGALSSVVTLVGAMQGVNISSKGRYKLADALNTIIAHCVHIGDMKLARDWTQYRNSLFADYGYYGTILPLKQDTTENEEKITLYQEEF